MNLIDNGIKTIIKIERVISDTELYFLVVFIDLYNRERSKRVMNIENIEDLTWSE